MNYVGDLSIGDVNVLADAGMTATSIVEFGSGASTQIFAQIAPRLAEITSVETDAGWIARTRAILDAIGHGDRVAFKGYDTWASEIDEQSMPTYDLAFNDGTDPLRADFAARIWTKLKIGGKLLFHDTRRPNDAQNLLQFCLTHFLEVRSIEMNAGSSNISVVTKKVYEPYRDWNVGEARNPLMVGLGPLDETISYMRNENRPSLRSDS